jgi:outer membrane protein OmpA-like peptidoglycan-associated protein
MTSRLAALSSLALLAACASKANLVVVIPEDNGHIGAVQVESGGSTTLLTGAYAALGGGSGGMKPVQVASGEVGQIFGTALSAQPIPPKTYTLYFISDSDDLTPDSKQAFEEVFNEIARRKAAELAVTGYTDTLGDPTYNDQLSLKRAKAVRELFIARGLKGEDIVAAGRGERDLLIPTADQKSEPRNRRVEITVR